MANSKPELEQVVTKRESSYPVFALPEAVKIAEAVKELGGARNPVQKSILAKHFRVAESAPSFFQRVGAAKSFGLIEGRGAYALTERAKRLFYPTTETDKGLALLECLTCPKAFGKIVELFDGEELPRTEMLGNILHREANVPVSWKDRAVNIFLRSAQHLGVIDQSGILRHGAHMKSGILETPSSGSKPSRSESNNFAHPTEEKPAALTRSRRMPPPASTENTRVWTFAEGDQQLRVETPQELSMSLWQLLEHYVQYLKPHEGGKEPTTNP